MMVRLLWVMLFAFPIGVAAGQVLLKLSAQQVQPGASLWTLATNPLLASGVALYGALGVLWIIILQHLPLNTAYPFVALSFAITPLLAWVVLGEKPGSVYFLGIALICTGVALTQRAVHAG
jgi:drug/metabolite transporter (DMT)-like permease